MRMHFVKLNEMSSQATRGATDPIRGNGGDVNVPEKEVKRARV